MYLDTPALGFGRAGLGSKYAKLADCIADLLRRTTALPASAACKYCCLATPLLAAWP